MPRLFAASFVLAAFSCAPSNAADNNSLPAQSERLVIQCPASKVMIDNPDQYWDESKFTCDEEGRVRFKTAINQ